MSNERDYLKIISDFIPEKQLYEIYKNKYINNFGIKCSKLEFVKINKEKLKKNLLKPANKKYFEKWLFGYFKYLQKEDKEYDDNSEYRILFDQLIKTYFNQQKEEFNECSLKLERLIQNKVIAKSKDQNKFLKNEEDTIESTKLVKKLTDKINNLQKELQERENIHKTLKDKLQNRIENLSIEIKKMQSEISKKDKQLFGMKSIENEIVILKKSNNDLENDNKHLKSEVTYLKNHLENISKKEVEVIGSFNTDLAVHKSIKVTFLDIDKITDLKILSNELWILEYSLTPKEKFKVESMLKNVQIKNNIIKITSYNDLLKNINTSKGMEVF